MGGSTNVSTRSGRAQYRLILQAGTGDFGNANPAVNEGAGVCQGGPDYDLRI